MNATTVIPERLELETVHGCNARCTMCPVHSPSRRKKGAMPFDLFAYVVDEMVPNKEHITKFDLFGLGEPLLDKNLLQKVAYAKGKGFRSLGISTNGELLHARLAEQLFEAGLDVIIFSIDGIRKETHEAIRINTHFERVVENAERAIARRNEGGYSARLIFRFIRQPANYLEWHGFQEYWGARISKTKGDMLIRYDAHTWGNEVHMPGIAAFSSVPDHTPCHHIFDRLIVLCDGTVPLCCVDFHHANYAFGNVKDASPIEVFNSPRAQKIRGLHKEGRRLSLNICARCTLLESENLQEIQ